MRGIQRGARILKIQQKISSRLTSDDVTQNRLDIRSYINAAREHGKNATVHRTLDPWPGDVHPWQLPQNRD